jgi:hypothetical protein
VLLVLRREEDVRREEAHGPGQEPAHRRLDLGGDATERPQAMEAGCEGDGDDRRQQPETDDAELSLNRRARIP